MPLSRVPALCGRINFDADQTHACTQRPVVTTGLRKQKEICEKYVLFMACVTVGARWKRRSRRCELTAARRWLVYVSVSLSPEEATWWAPERSAGRRPRERKSNGAQSTVISGARCIRGFHFHPGTNLPRDFWRSGQFSSDLNLLRMKVDSFDSAAWCAMLIRTFLDLVRVQINPKEWGFEGIQGGFDFY